jgi:hypothetical protein
MNVILVNGIYDIMPSRSLGPYLLRHILEKNHYSCQVIDHCQEFTADEMYELIKHFIDDSTICLGFSTTFWRDIEQKIWNNNGGMPPNLDVASRRIKAEFPHIKIVLGGAGIRNVGRKVDHVDALVVGEAEDLFIELLDHWTKGMPEPAKKTNAAVNKPYYNQCTTKNYDISGCDFMWSQQDAIVYGEPLPLETARGCIFKCKFCSYPHLGKKKMDYLKPIDHIKNHLIHNYENWGTTHYIMLDDTFNDSEYKIDTLLDMTRTLPFKIGYVAYIRADLVHRFEGMAEKLQESGLESCFFGLESLHPVASQAVGKGWSGRSAREYIPHLLHNTWNDRVNVTTGFIAGLPGEDADSLRDTLKWVNDNDIMTFWLGLGISSPASLMAGSMDGVAFYSEFERNAEQYGYKFDEAGWWYNDLWNHHSAQKFAMEDLNYKRKLKRISCWFHIQLRAFGYTDEELWAIAGSQLTHNGFLTDQTFIKRKKEYVSNYKKLLLSL